MEQGSRGHVMSLPRYAAKVDANQKEIVDALKAIGCDVEVIGRPVDLLVGYRFHNFLIEIKREGHRPRKDQKAQQDWIKEWPGQVRVVETAEQAIKLVTDAYKKR
jgi:hypothetical protein